MNLVAPPRQDDGGGEEEGEAAGGGEGDLRGRFKKLLASGVALGSVFSTLSEHRIAEDIPQARELALPPMAWEANVGVDSGGAGRGAGGGDDDGGGGGGSGGEGKGEGKDREDEEDEVGDFVSALARASRGSSGSKADVAEDRSTATVGEGVVAAAAARGAAVG